MKPRNENIYPTGADPCFLLAASAHFANATLPTYILSGSGSGNFLTRWHQPLLHPADVIGQLHAQQCSGVLPNALETRTAISGNKDAIDHLQGLAVTPQPLDARSRSTRTQQCDLSDTGVFIAMVFDLLSNDNLPDRRPEPSLPQTGKQSGGSGTRTPTRTLFGLLSSHAGQSPEYRTPQWFPLHPEPRGKVPL